MRQPFPRVRLVQKISCNYIYRVAVEDASCRYSDLFKSWFKFVSRVFKK